MARTDRSRLSERELLRAALERDQDAFAATFERYRRPLLAYCRGLLRDHDAAEDAVQETFVRVWRNIESFDLERRFWPWLQTIAQRICYDMARVGTRSSPRDREYFASMGSAVLLEDESAVDARLDAERSRAKLRRALACLPQRYERLFVLQAVEGWTYRQLADADGSTVTSVGKVISRARLRLREQLGGTGPGFAFVPFIIGVAKRWNARARVALSNVSYADSAAPALVQQFSVAVVGLVLAGSGFSAAELGSGASSSFVAAPSTRTAVSEARATTPSPGASARTAAQERIEARRTDSAMLIVSKGTQKPGQVDPTGGSFSVEVRDGRGARLVWLTDNHDCGDRGPLTPPGSPIEARC